MRDRQPCKNNPYYLPNSLYRRVLSIVRDYDRRCAERDNILYGTSRGEDGMPIGTDVGRPTERAAEKISLINDEITAIDRALQCVPKDYAIHILDNVRYYQRFPDTADRMTWSKWRCRFLFFAAENLKLL